LTRTVTSTDFRVYDRTAAVVWAEEYWLVLKCGRLGGEVPRPIEEGTHVPVLDDHCPSQACHAFSRAVALSALTSQR
jgi:hypothetical protein